MPAQISQTGLELWNGLNAVSGKVRLHPGVKWSALEMTTRDDGDDVLRVTLALTEPAAASVDMDYVWRVIGDDATVHEFIIATIDESVEDDTVTMTCTAARTWLNTAAITPNVETRTNIIGSHTAFIEVWAGWPAWLTIGTIPTGGLAYTVVTVNYTSDDTVLSALISLVSAIDATLDPGVGPCVLQFRRASDSAYVIDILTTPPTGTAVLWEGKNLRTMGRTRDKTKGTATTSYRFEVVDGYRVDSATYPLDKLTCYDTARFVSASLGVDTSVRISELVTDYATNVTRVQLGQPRRRLVNQTAAVAEQAASTLPTQLTGLEAVHWTNAYALLSGNFPSTEDMDFTYGYARRMNGEFVGTTTGISVPVGGLYHVTMELQWRQNIVTTPPPALRVGVYPADHYNTDGFASVINYHADENSFGYTISRHEGSMYMEANEEMLFEINALNGGSAYQGQVQAVNIVIAKIGELPATRFAPPKSLSRGAVTATTIALTFQVGVAGADTEIRKDGVLALTVASPGTSGSLTGLTANTGYALTARHVDTPDESVWRKYSWSGTNNSFSSVWWTRPNTPTSCTLTAMSSTSMKVDWVRDHTGLPVRIYRSSVLRYTSDDTETTWTETGLTANTSYTYQVYHWNVESGWQSTAAASATASTPP